jgi:hypothetical protein
MPPITADVGNPEKSVSDSQGPTTANAAIAVDQL